MTRNPPQALVAVLIVGFLIFYTAQKYLAAAPEGFVPAYVISVALLVGLTALLPLAMSALAIRVLPGRALKFISAAALPLALSAGGFTLYWAAFLAPNFGIGLEVVLPRAVFPGISLGVLLIAYVFAHRPVASEMPGPSATLSSEAR